MSIVMAFMDQKKPKPTESSGHLSSSTEPGAVTLPIVTLRNVITKSEFSTDNLKGKVVLLNFWASWCEACIEEMPSIVKLNTALRDKGFEILSINLDDNPEKTIPQVVDELKMNFPVYNDSNEALAKTFQVVALPLTVILDRQLNVVRKESGARDWASDDTIRELQSIIGTP